MPATPVLFRKKQPYRNMLQPFMDSHIISALKKTYALFPLELSPD